ncbi:MAG: 3-deoxy-8-phosphooctulonate synthase [Phycisphaerae bacterium]|nr:3-deoxy-8-phosphooctulonate synthase [Phycisphaerae bacterium]
MNKIITIGSDGGPQVTLGENSGLVLMGGPCVIEGLDICLKIAENLKELTAKLGIGYVFKASFDKANRTSSSSFRGPGIQEGLRILDQVKREFEVPVVSDIHLPEQAVLCAEVLDVMQIPAFLARQTDILEAAGRTGKCVQVKKGQFMAPWDMKNVIEKINGQGNENVTLVERGSSFGYNRLVVDMCGIVEMKKLGVPVVMDATHSTQQPGGLGNSSGGAPEMAPVLARAAMASGADGLFIETHPNPAKALSDAACMMPLSEMKGLLESCKAVYEAVRG